MQALDETLTVAQRTELILTLLHGLCSRDHLSSDLASHLLLMVLESHGVEPGQVGTGRPAAEGSGRGDRDGHVRGCPGACVSTRPTPWGPWSPGRPRQWAAFPARGPGLRRAPGPCLVHNLVQGKRDAGPPGIQLPSALPQPAQPRAHRDTVFPGAARSRQCPRMSRRVSVGWGPHGGLVTPVPVGRRQARPLWRCCPQAPSAPRPPARTGA